MKCIHFSGDLNRSGFLNPIAFNIRSENPSFFPQLIRCLKL